MSSVEGTPIRKILLVWPRFPDTFWSFNHALPFLGKKAYVPPLGLLTVAAYIPRDIAVRLVDLNTRALDDADMEWADVVFVSAMIVQAPAVVEIVQRCKAHGRVVVAGGPFFTESFDNFDFVLRGSGPTFDACIDHYVLGEGEDILAEFVADFLAGKARRVYRATGFPDITGTPVPRWDLIDAAAYQSLPVQYSRGCPFNCEFCDIVVLNGHKPRTKTVFQVIAELEAILATGFRGVVFFVDDNFIGNTRKLKAEVLPAIVAWQEQHGHPFTFNTEASMNLASDHELVDLLVRAGFRSVFLGIETPSESALKECGKVQNTHLDLLRAVKYLQGEGLTVHAGFIVGFDSDDETIFDRQFRFIQEAGICGAMVGVLQVGPKTRLHARLSGEGRLVQGGVTGDNLSDELTFVPKMGADALVAGYRRLLARLYSPRHYFARAKTFLEAYKIIPSKTVPRAKAPAGRFLKILWAVGVRKGGRWPFWKLFGWALFKRPAALLPAISLALTGYHYEKIARSISGRSSPPPVANGPARSGYFQAKAIAGAK